MTCLEELGESDTLYDAYDSEKKERSGPCCPRCYAKWRMIHDGVDPSLTGEALEKRRKQVSENLRELKQRLIEKGLATEVEL
jgi:hypothetical protein